MIMRQKFIIDKEKFYLARHTWLTLLPSIVLYFYNGKVDTIMFDFLLWDINIEL